MRASAAYLDNRSGLQALLTGDGELSDTKAVALLLHGGKENSVDPTEARQLAVLRMAPLARHLVSVGAEHGLAVWRLRFRYRGWNNAAEHPMEDLSWALRQLRQRHGGAPIVIVGHSMGGRVAMRAAGKADVAGVLGLAPWLPAGEPIEQLAGSKLLVAHGLRDRITSAQRAREFVDDVRPIADQATFIGLRGCGHSMLRRSRLWSRLTRQFVLHAGIGIEPTAPLADCIAAGECEI
ncbi:MAG: alpha/beta hydrolase [Acidothermaceae bacterium]